jgi:prephenate dehydratase/chorismate mutase
MSNDLEKIRAEIDAIDSEILRLVGKRFEYAVRTRRLKESLIDTDREQAILEQARRNARWLVSREFAETLSQYIMSESKKLQQSAQMLTGFFGVHGSLAEAALAHSKQVAIPVPYESHEELFNHLHNGTIDNAIIPFERVSDARLEKSLSLLLDSELTVTGDITIAPSYALMALPESNYRDIKIVYGHPEVLSRASSFLKRMKLEGHPYHESAAAALMLRQDRPLAAGVIAPMLCADVYNLHIIKDLIDDKLFDTARFLRIGKTPCATGSKTMLYFSIHHSSGNLSSVLELFSQHKINLLKIESLPTRDALTIPFLLEFEGSPLSDAGRNVLDEFSKHSIPFRVLGTYDSL